MVNDMETSEDDMCLEQPNKRWDPLGADENFLREEKSQISAFSSPIQECSNGSAQFSSSMDTNRIRSLEDEQEVLTTSLMALTSHFAQVQFRLRQIVEAPSTHRDQLLKSLEEFAFRGIPELTRGTNCPATEETLVHLERARSRQFELIDRLKTQLTELEKFAYESGAPVVPQSIIVEKQKIIIDEFKNKLNLNVNDVDLPQLSHTDIKTQIETAIGEFVGPLRMKEQLVVQLKTQIADLERFIAFLQQNDEQTGLEDIKLSIGSTVNSNAPSNYTGRKKRNCYSKNDTEAQQPQHSKKNQFSVNPSTSNETFSSKTHSLLSKASTLLQMFAITQFGCSSSSTSQFRKNTLKKSQRGNHWGDIRAQLEVDIQEVVSLAIALQQDQRKQIRTIKSTLKQYESYASDSEEEETGFISSMPSNAPSKNLIMKDFILTNVELTSFIRKKLAVTLQKLIQHGLRSDRSTPVSSIVPFIRCFSPPSPMRGSDYRNMCETEKNFAGDTYGQQMHAWELILKYYMIKNGESYNESTARKLSQSFNLEIVGNNATISNKQSLLSTIGTIIAIHKPYKRSCNAHFKAFVCAALNAKNLASWLNLIFQSNDLINAYYMNWSYVAQTGFRDALHSLDSLTKYEFDLPIDLAIRQFQNIKDVFM